jgi:hypothetical protein
VKWGSPFEAFGGDIMHGRSASTAPQGRLIHNSAGIVSAARIYRAKLPITIATAGAMSIQIHMSIVPSIYLGLLDARLAGISGRTGDQPRTHWIYKKLVKFKILGS